MKQYFLLLLPLFILFIPVVHSEQSDIPINTGLDVMISNYYEFTMVIGEAAQSSDLLAGIKIVSSMQNRTDINLSTMKRTSKLGPGMAVLSKEIQSTSDLDNQHVIIIGGPCANPVWTLFSNESCENWPYKPGQAFIKIVKHDAFYLVLVGGTTKEDTAALAEEIVHYSDTNIFTSTEEVRTYSN